MTVLVLVIQSLRVIVPLRVGVAYRTLAERKVMGSVQRRQGPNAVGLYGVGTPLADGLKLFLKETVIPASANPGRFLAAPRLTFILSLIAWSVMPIFEGGVYANPDRGRLYLLAVSSLAVYGIIMAGWSSNSKYAFLGALRSAAQMVSYEVSIGFVRVTVIMCAQTANLSARVDAQRAVWFIVPLLPRALRFFVSILAETNRHPFDLPEAEAERVSGYNVEYSSMTFARFFLGEYGNMILMSTLFTVLFLGGWHPIPFLADIRPFTLPGALWCARKTVTVLLGFIWARVAYPRYRYDQLMRLGWKVFLPVTLGWVMRVSGRLRGLNVI